MGNVISKVSVGLPQLPVARHNNNRDIETTCDIGTVQTLQMKVMNGNSTFDCTRWSSVVRIGAMPVPTFGRLKYKMYHRFIKMEDIMPSFSAFLEGKPYTGSTLTYIPQSMPYVTFAFLSRYILSVTGRYGQVTTDDPLDQPFSYYRVYECSQYAGSGIHEGQRIAVPLTADQVDDIEVPGSSFYQAFYNYCGISIEYDRNAYQPSDEAGFYSRHIDNISLENADYIVRFSATLADEAEHFYYVCFRLTRGGKSLVKHLNALGWKFDLFNRTRRVALPYVIGLYKCYFDMMMPAKDFQSPRTWDMTNAFKLMHWFIDNNKYTFNIESSSDSTVVDFFTQFLFDLSQTFYYDDTNYLSAHIASPSISPATVPGLSSPLSLEISPSNYSAGSTTANRSPILRADLGTIGNYPVTTSAWNIRLLLRLLAYQGKDTVLGGQIRDSLKAHYGFDVEEHGGISYNVGSFSMDVIISDIYSTADTRDSDDKGSYLGSLGGKATAFTGDAANPDPFMFKFEAPSFGMLYSFAVVVPESGFCQGVDNNLSRGATSKWEIYNSMLDSLGYDLSKKDIFFGERLVSFNPNSPSVEAYGYIPRMTDTKITTQNILNGDLARRSTRRQLLAYTLNKYITPPDVAIEGTVPDNPGRFYVSESLGASIPVASPDINSFGRPWMMNFNRIFYLDDSFLNTLNPAPGSFPVLSSKLLFGFDDEFIVQNVLNCDYYDHSKPVSESFESDGDSGRTIDRDFSGK